MLKKSTFAVVMTAITISASAQVNYPSKPITIANPGPAGGAIDAPARAIAEGISQIKKVPVITQNLPGGGGTIATARVASASPDGYTLLFHHIGVATAPAQYSNLPFNTLKDLVPIGLSTEVPVMIVARKDFPPTSTKELIAYLKTHKDKVTVATSGPGSVSDLCAALLMKQLGERFTLVPYKGSPPALLDISAGRVDMICDQTSTAAAQVKGGNIKTYGVASKKRLPILMDIPTLDEQGFPFEFSIWQGLYAPAGTPEPIIRDISNTLEKAVQTPSVRKQLEVYGIIPIDEMYRTPEGHKKRLEDEIKIWANLYKDLPKK